MDTAKVIVGEVQSARGLEIVELFGVGIRQACEAANRHSHIQILPFNEARRDVTAIRPTVADLYYRLYHRSRRVAPRRFVLPVIAVYLYQLGKVGLPGEYSFYALAVEREAVRCQLKAVLFGKAAMKTSKKCVRRFARPLAHSECRNQFGVCIQSDEYPCISQFSRFSDTNIALLLSYISPNFVSLDSGTTKIFHSRFHKNRAAFTCKYKKPQDGVTMQLRDSFRTANAGSFKQQLNCQERFVLRYGHCPEQTYMIFGVCLAALGATKTAKPIPVLPEFSAFKAARCAIHKVILQQAVAVCQGGNLPFFPAKDTPTFLWSHDRNARTLQTCGLA